MEKKMKKFIVVILLFLPGIAFAQREAYNWYFPSNRAVTFNTKDGHPVSLTDGNLYGGSPATYSDSEGNLLFYSNGDTVWNRLHKPMPMGFLDNNLSYVRYGTMIFPKPGSISQYYIFYIDQSTKNPNLKFSVVDMNLDNGFGDVVLPNSSLDSSIASFSAVNHANGIDVWLITYDYQIMQFKVYLISKSGINSNQKSFSSNPDNQSYNPDNNGIYTSPKVNFFVFHQYFITDLYSFDNRTGNVNFLTNIDTILQNSKQHFHGWFGGSEFSESGKRIFIFSLDSLPGSKNSFRGLTNQYNLDIPDIHQIRSTKLLVHADSGDIHYGNICAGIGFKLGPDKRIYFSYCDWRYLSCISFPDSFGISCDFQYNKIPILKGFDNLNGGLQNILPCYYCFYAFANSPICEGDTIFLSANLSKRFLSPKFEWSGPNGFSSFEQSPVIINSKYENTGLYRLKVTADTTDLYDSVYVQVYPRPIAQILTQGDLDLCKTASVILSSKETDKTFIYHWSTGESKQKIPVKVPGVYILTVTNPAGCSSVDSIEVKGIEKFAISAIGSPAICYGDTTELFVTPINKEYRYSWSTGDTTPNTKISKAGIYKVFVSYLNCLDSAFIIVDSLPTPKPKINGPNSVCLNSVVDYYLSSLLSKC